MTHGTFLWADLSAYRPQTARKFYSDLFGWAVPPQEYAIASYGNVPVAGLFQMPEKFIDMGMPSFWMSYIAVNNVETAIETARLHGGKVEIGPADFEGGGRYALIRDPLGAGFTVYEGRALDGALTGTGGRRGHALFVSDAAAVMPFYAALFGWSFGASDSGTRQILNRSHVIAHLHEIPDPAIRGKEQYWAILFDAPPQAPDRIRSLGGQVVATVTLPEGPATVARDPDGAAFFTLQTPSTEAPGDRPTTPIPRNWRAIAGLGLIGLGIATGWSWISAIFFAIWIAIGLRDKATYLFEPVTRAEAPVLYWLILGCFAALGGFALIGY